MCFGSLSCLGIKVTNPIFCFGSVVWECWSEGVRVWNCGSGGAHPRQVRNYENINAQFLVIYIFINAHGHL